MIKNSSIPEIYFFVPVPDIVQNLPPTIEKYWEWINDYLDSPKAITPWDGPFSWTIQTYIYLHSNGFPCYLVSSFPKKGIVISHRYFLKSKFFQGKNIEPSRELNIVEIKSDRELTYMFSNFVIIQNKKDPINRGISRFLIKSFFITHWPQPSLIPRNNDRGDRFEKICFMGNENQLYEGLHNLELEKLDLKWQIVNRKKWNDYSEVDAIVALRPELTSDYPDKPATKLINAWLAGVPAILGPESAFRNLRKSSLDYLEAKTVDEVIENLKLLQRDVPLRRAMVENGRKRAQEFSPQEIIKEWNFILLNKIVPIYINWSNSILRRYCFFILRKFYVKLFT